MQRNSARNFGRTLGNQAGMTLMEILIVMAIIGGMMAIITPIVLDRLATSQVKNTRLAMNQIVQALALYNTDCGAYPSSLEGLQKQDECTSWGPTPYLKKEIKDAWGKSFVYEKTEGDYILKSLGKDGREGGDGVNAEITSENL